MYRAIPSRRGTSRRRGGQVYAGTASAGRGATLDAEEAPGAAGLAGLGGGQGCVAERSEWWQDVTVAGAPDEP